MVVLMVGPLRLSWWAVVDSEAIKSVRGRCSSSQASSDVCV